MEETSLRTNLAPESLTRLFSVEVPATRKPRAFLHSSKKQGGATSSRPFLHAPAEFGGWKPALLPFFYRASAGPGRWGSFSISFALSSVSQKSPTGPGPAQSNQKNGMSGSNSFPGAGSASAMKTGTRMSSLPGCPYCFSRAERGLRREVISPGRFSPLIAALDP